MRSRLACLSALLLLGLPRAARCESWGDPVRVFFEALPAIQVQAPAIGILNTAYAKAALSPIPAAGPLDAIVALKARVDERISEDGLSSLVLALNFSASVPMDQGLRKKLTAARFSAARRLSEMRQARTLAWGDKTVEALLGNRPLGPDDTRP